MNHKVQIYISSFLLIYSRYLFCLVNFRTNRIKIKKTIRKGKNITQARNPALSFSYPTLLANSLHTVYIFPPEISSSLHATHGTRKKKPTRNKKNKEKNNIN